MSAGGALGAPPPTATANAPPDPGALETALRRARSEGRKLLVPYVTGGLDSSWTEVVRAVVSAGADAVEVGIPFSDPMIDGPTIQDASRMALARGTTPATVLGELGRLDAGAPVAVMTYANVVLKAGARRMAELLARQGVAGAIVPDLPYDELGEWGVEAARAGVETVLLAAPTTPPERLEAICEHSRGFIYGVGLLGVTGERQHLADSARQMARRLKGTTDKPVLIGVGISGPDQARQVCQDADGVVVGSALVRRLLEGAGPEGAADFVGELRAALDA